MEGEPGTPDVANKIFERIGKCAIFVADITPIGETPKRRPPNPNVMIEYGFAEKAVTDARILTVFNEAFGDWETDRPFDLRHKRRPITYQLAERHSEKELATVKKSLTKILKTAIKDIIEAAPLDSSEPVHETPSQKVSRIAAELKFEEDKEAFIADPESVEASDRAFQNLVDLVQSKVEELIKNYPHMQLIAQMCDTYLVVHGKHRFVVTGWHRQAANTIRGALLVTKIHDGMPKIKGYGDYRQNPKTLHKEQFEFGLIAPGEEGYIRSDGDLFSLQTLAEHLISLWLEAVSPAKR